MLFDEGLNSPVAVRLCPDMEPRYSCGFALVELNEFETEPLTRSGEADARWSTDCRTAFDLSGTNIEPLTVAGKNPTPRVLAKRPSCTLEFKCPPEVNMVVVDREASVTAGISSAVGITAADNAPVDLGPCSVEIVCCIEPFTPVGTHEVPDCAKVEYVSEPTSPLRVISRDAAMCISAVQRSSVSLPNVFSIRRGSRR